MQKYYTLPKIEKTRLQNAYEVLTNVAYNKSLDDYDKFRRIMININSSPNVLKISSSEDLEKDKYIFETRKNNKELNNKWQYITGIGSIAVGIVTIIELVCKDKY